MRREGRPAIGMSAFTAGLVAIVLMVVGIYFAYAKRVPWASDHEVKVVFAQANEVNPRSPVRIAGIQVGEVKEVEPGPGATAVVTMALEEEALPLHEDATVKIRPRIFLEGNFFLDLQPGTPSAPKLDEGDTIPIGNTAGPVQFDQILTSLPLDTRDNLRSLLKGYADTLREGGAGALHRQLRALPGAFRPAAQAAEATRGRRPDDLSRFIADAGLTAEALTRRERLPDLVTGFNRTVRAFAARRRELAASVRGLDATVEEAGPALSALNRAFPPTRALLRDARPGIRAAPATLRLATPLLVEARRIIGRAELPALLDELDPAIRGLAALEPKLEDAFEQVTPVTECLRRNAVPTVKSPVQDPPNTTGAPVYMELLYALTGLASASQNFDGNGPAVRYHAGFGDQLVTLGRSQGGDPIVGLAPEPIIGSRPRMPAEKPPFRPDVPCTSQKPPDLSAQTGPAPRQRTVSVRKRPPLPREVRRKVERAAKRDATRRAEGRR